MLLTYFEVLSVLSNFTSVLPIYIAERILYVFRCPRGLSGIEFTKELLQEKVLVVPGEVMGLPGYIRLSLTCSDGMVEFALPVFKRLMTEGPRTEDDGPSELPTIARTRAFRRRSSITLGGWGDYSKK